MERRGTGHVGGLCLLSWASAAAEAANIVSQLSCLLQAHSKKNLQRSVERDRAREDEHLAL